MRLLWCGEWRASEENRGGRSCHSERAQHVWEGGVHRALVVTSEATNREEGMSQSGSNKDVVKTEWSWKNRCTYRGDREGGTVADDDGGRM
jgi:hypothetical protein